MLGFEAVSTFILMYPHDDDVSFQFSQSKITFVPQIASFSNSDSKMVVL